MNKLNIHIKNCYGIGTLDSEIGYNVAKKSAIVYAPNGTMKTSLTKTIQDIIDSKEPKDEMYPDREHECCIQIDDTDITKDSVFIFRNEDADGSKEISTFLVDATLKARYDAIYALIEDAQKSLLRAIKSVAHSTDCKKEILNTFRINEQESLLDCLLRIRGEIDETSNIAAEYDFKYNEIFDNDKVITFILEQSDKLNDYFSKYSELIRDSSIFSAGPNSFGTSQASTLLKSVDDNRFFSANHKFVLRGDVEITTKTKMEELITKEKERILNDRTLKTIFERIDKKLQSNGDLRRLKEIIEQYPEIIPELLDYDNFQKKILRRYLYDCIVEYDSLIAIYAAHQEEINSIINEANGQRSQWERVIDMFNNRFYVPFRIRLKNKSDIILNQETAALEFVYQDEDNGSELVVEQKSLLEHLSRGELKAYYILQNLFEIEARKSKGQETLLIFDDIADSFDYKNKYAIVEYLADIVQEPCFFLFILTHNFDFYRTAVSRLNIHNVYFGEKNPQREIKLHVGLYKTDILHQRILRKIVEIRACIAAIPFSRNIIEYAKGDSDSDYQKLTECLHVKTNTQNITMSEIWDIHQRSLKAAYGQTISFGELKYYDALIDQAEKILTESNEVELVDKLILSMAIRLKAELYMLRELTPNQAQEIAPNRNQTGELVKVFKTYHSQNKERECLLMNKVLMMTSETIHLNNFMFEPIVDTSIWALKKLYRDVSVL